MTAQTHAALTAIERQWKLAAQSSDPQENPVTSQVHRLNAQPVKERVSAQKWETRVAVFRVAEDGTLSYVRSREVDVGEAFLWWMGMLEL